MVEPAGVAAVAAVLADPAAFAPPVVAVIRGNIDPVLLLKVIQHGLAAAGRYLSLRLRVTEPGSLAAVLAELAAGANVLEVEHERTESSCTSARSRCSSSSRRAGPTTPRRSARRSPAPGTPSPR